MPAGMPGKLIVVEGLDGSGKSTQAHLLRRWLEIEGYRVYFTEWNSSPLVKNVTKRGKKDQLLTPTYIFNHSCHGLCRPFRTADPAHAPCGVHCPGGSIHLHRFRQGCRARC